MEADEAVDDGGDGNDESVTKTVSSVDRKGEAGAHQGARGSNTGDDAVYNKVSLYSLRC
jgi:hypothetical protein